MLLNGMLDESAGKNRVVGCLMGLKELAKDDKTLGELKLKLDAIKEKIQLVQNASLVGLAGVEDDTLN